MVACRISKTPPTRILSLILPGPGAVAVPGRAGYSYTATFVLEVVPRHVPRHGSGAARRDFLPKVYSTIKYRVRIRQKNPKSMDFG